MTFEQGVSISRCIEVIREGGVIAYPTDTVYALGADIFNKCAVMSIYSIKLREQNKPLLVNIADLSQLQDCLEPVQALELELMRRFWPGPLTLILRVNSRIPDFISKGNATMGVRVPNHPLALSLLREYGTPLISTSINYSGDPPLLDDLSIKCNFSQLIDYLLGEHEVCSGQPSTIVQVVGDKLKIIRQGMQIEALQRAYPNRIIY